jgi:hypothetical protein
MNLIDANDHTVLMRCTVIIQSMNLLSFTGVLHDSVLPLLKVTRFVDVAVVFAGN